MKKLFRMTLFKKIFLTIFIGLFIVETINVYFDYESICVGTVRNHINSAVAGKLSSIEKYFEENEQYSSQEDIIQFVEESLKEFPGYYVIMDESDNILYEQTQFSHFSEEPYMKIGPASCFEEEVLCDVLPTKVSLKHLPQEALDKLEDYIQKNPRHQTIIVTYAGNTRWLVEETGGKTPYVEPTFLQVDDVVIFGDEPDDKASGGVYMYASQDLYYRDYTTSEDKEAYYIDREVLLKSSRKAAVDLYDEYGGIGRTRIGYQKQNNDLIISQSIHVYTEYGECIRIAYVNYYAKAFSDAVENAIRSNITIYVLTLFLSLFMSFVISYMITRRIKKIEVNTREIADNHFDIRLKEKPNDELGALSHSINEMSSKLKKTMEELNEEIDNVKKLESLRKEFIANFTHEIKTPLGIINGYIELIEVIDDKEKKQQYLEAINQETDRINELVLAMLNLSRLESGKVDFHVTDVDLEDLISSTIDSFASLLQKKKIQIELTGKESSIQADPVQLQMVIKNFVSNAIKHTPEGMKIYVHYDEKTISIENEGSHIEEDKMETIWETYVSSDREGTGLGLAICKTILDMHDFGYKVENTEKGVCFIVEM